MSALTHLYWTIFHGRRLWGEPPVAVPFLPFRETLNSAMEEMPAGLHSLPCRPDSRPSAPLPHRWIPNRRPPPAATISRIRELDVWPPRFLSILGRSEFTPGQWRALNLYYLWYQKAHSNQPAADPHADIAGRGTTTYRAGQFSLAMDVYNQFHDKDLRARESTWKQHIYGIRDLPRYARRRGFGVGMVLLLALLPVISVVDFTRATFSEKRSAWFWGPADVQTGGTFGEKIVWLIPWKEHDGLLNEREMTTSEKQAHTGNVIGLASFLFFPIAGLTGLLCSRRVLSAGLDTSSLIKQYYECLCAHDLGAGIDSVDKEIHTSITRIFSWSLLGALFWWVPAAIITGVAFLALLIIAGVVLTVAHSVKKGVTGKD